MHTTTIHAVPAHLGFRARHGLGGRRHRRARRARRASAEREYEMVREQLLRLIVSHDLAAVEWSAGVSEVGVERRLDADAEQ